MIQLTQAQTELLLRLLGEEMARLGDAQQRLMSAVGLSSGVAIRWQSHALDLKEQQVLETIRKLFDEV